jgi:hypothetical protein
MRHINPLYVHKALHDIAGKIGNATVLKKVTLLIELFDEKQAEILLLFTSSADSGEL